MMREASRKASSLFLALACWSVTGRAEAGTERLVLEPAEVVLRDAGESTQFLATLELADGTRRDVTRAARFESTNPAVIRVENGRIVPTGNGKARRSKS